MKLSVMTIMSVFIMTSYITDACYFTNCPNKWEWRKRSGNDVINENLEQRANFNPLLKGYLEKNEQEVKLIYFYLDFYVFS